MVDDEGFIAVAGSEVWYGTFAYPALLRFTPEGDVDPGFNGGAMASLRGRGGGIADLVALPDRSLVVVGGISSFPRGPSDVFAARVLLDGSFDASFGGPFAPEGIVRLDIGGFYDAALAVAMQPDGKVVLGAKAWSATTALDFAAIRLWPDGTYDESFGDDGVVILPRLGSTEEAQGIAVQADGKIVLGGHRLFFRDSASLEFDFLVARLWEDGSLDTGFGESGWAQIGVGDGSFPFYWYDQYFELGLDLALQPDEKIVLSGTAAFAPSTPDGETELDAVILRFDQSGALDPLFGDGGAAVFGYPGRNDEARSMAIQPDGRIVVAGPTVVGGSYARLLSDGFDSSDGFFARVAGYKGKPGNGGGGRN